MCASIVGKPNTCLWKTTMPSYAQSHRKGRERKREQTDGVRVSHVEVRVKCSVAEGRSLPPDWSIRLPFRRGCRLTRARHFARVQDGVIVIQSHHATLCLIFFLSFALCVRTSGTSITLLPAATKASPCCDSRNAPHSSNPPCRSVRRLRTDPIRGTVTRSPNTALPKFRFTPFHILTRRKTDARIMHKQSRSSPSRWVSRSLPSPNNPGSTAASRGPVAAQLGVGCAAAAWRGESPSQRASWPAVLRGGGSSGLNGSQSIQGSFLGFGNNKCLSLSVWTRRRFSNR